MSLSALAAYLPYSLPQLMLILLVFFLAGTVKGVVGLGLPTISMALLSLFMTPAQAAAMLVIPSLVTNLWQAGPLATLPGLLRSLGGMQVCIFAGTLLGALLLGAPAGQWASVALGVALVLYAGWGLLGRVRDVPPLARRWAGPLAGFVTGGITAATGVFVIPAVPYLQALGLSRNHLIQAMGISFTVSTVALALGLWLNGSYPAASAGISLLMLAPALLGMMAGQRLRNVLSVRAFKIVFFFSLILLGIYQTVDGIA